MIRGASTKTTARPLVWRNLSAPQRNAMRQLRDRGSAAVGWHPGQFVLSERLAASLLKLGAAVVPDPEYRKKVSLRDHYSYIPCGTPLQLSAAGRACIGDRT